ncbi:hypothetical protein C1H46_031642 [Malus baccata]|uniref:Uncharacterized protein n=1 Tax=Malus baccata TaxID=106549 RepID=A0A540L986_MALBA|nr:hypothetical protein C1H46_031642 [Malus baccata]
MSPCSFLAFTQKNLLELYQHGLSSKSPDPGPRGQQPFWSNTKVFQEFHNHGKFFKFGMFSSGSYAFGYATFEENYVEKAILRDARRVDQPQGNLLVGNIPSKIGDMRWLESLVFLRNKLIGQISPSMSKLTFLSNLNLSYNYLTRQIPESTQLQSVDRSSFFGNKLCGHPQEKCNIKHVGSPVSLGNQREGIACLLEDGWFDLSLGLGFAFGFWSVLATLLLNMPWSTRFSQFQNNIVSKLYAIIQEKTISIRT